ncbi:MAG: hypothetical protein HKL96_09525 [Phycisphaerales bacterium]|nr:hypothetical protein [Phycisphaerales bacterium]
MPVGSICSSVEAETSTIYIEGSGLVTPMGTSPAEVLGAIIAGRRLANSGVVQGLPDLLQAILSSVHESHLVKTTSWDMTRPDRSIALALGAAVEAVRDAGWTAADLAAPDTHLFAATSKGPVLTQLAALRQLSGHDFSLFDRATAWQIALGPDAMACWVGDYIGIGGPRHTTVGACAGSLLAVHRAATELKRGTCKRAIVVAADASRHPLFEGSFANLGVLAPTDEQGRQFCTAMDEKPGGFFISEAAGAICMTTQRFANSPSANGHGEASRVVLQQSWSGGDATHLIATDPEAKALRRGLSHCKGSGSTAFVHAHATGTAHDQYELAAIRDAYGPAVEVFSHKRWLGHSLGAAGLVALVLSTQCHRQCMSLGDKTIASDAESVTIGQGFGGHIGICRLASMRSP